MPENQVGRASAIQQVGDMRLICGAFNNSSSGNGSASSNGGGGCSTPTTGPKRGIMKKSPTNEANLVFNHNNEDLLLPTIQLDSIKNYELNSYFQQHQQQQQEHQIQYSTMTTSKLPKSQTTPNMTSKRKETHVIRSDL